MDLTVIVALITAIVSIIAAVAAIVAPIATAKVQANKDLKIKQLDLVYREKLSAFKEFSEAFGKYIVTAPIIELTQLFVAKAYWAAMASTSSKTRQMILELSLFAQTKAFDRIKARVLFALCLESINNDLLSAQNGNAQKHKYNSNGNHSDAGAINQSDIEIGFERIVRSIAENAAQDKNAKQN